MTIGTPEATEFDEVCALFHRLGKNTSITAANCCGATALQSLQLDGNSTESPLQTIHGGGRAQSWSTKKESKAKDRGLSRFSFGRILRKYWPAEIMTALQSATAALYSQLKSFALPIGAIVWMFVEWQWRKPLEVSLEKLRWTCLIAKNE